MELYVNCWGVIFSLDDSDVQFVNCLRQQRTEICQQLWLLGDDVFIR